MKNVNIKPHSVEMRLTTSSPKISIKPGDMTVNYLLAFYSLALAPFYVIADAAYNELQFNFWQKSVFTVGLTLLIFMLVLKTNKGIKLIQNIIQYVKNTELR